MNKRRGIAIIFALLVIMVLTILLAAFFLKTVTEKQLAMRYVDSTRAFWLAEAGVARALSETIWPGNYSASVGNANYTYSAQVTHTSGQYYTIVSTGTVTLPNGTAISRTIKTSAKIGTTDPTKFNFGIETTSNLVVHGNVHIIPNDTTHGWKEHATLDFADLFRVTKDEMKASATHLYNSSNFAEPINGITWVDVTGSELSVTGNITGSGILIFNGNTKFAGTVNFHGIIYVIGKLTMHGTVDTFGSILAESQTTLDTTLTGDVKITYNPVDIEAALNVLAFLNKELVSWQEI